MSVDIFAADIIDVSISLGKTLRPRKPEKEIKDAIIPQNISPSTLLFCPPPAVMRARPASPLQRGSDMISVRRASRRDLEAIVDVIMAAMPMDPQWDWRFPRWREYPDDTRYFTMLKYDEFLQDVKNWRVMVAEVEDATTRRTKGTVIAVAVWGIGNLNRCASRRRSQFVKSR